MNFLNPMYLKIELDPLYELLYPIKRKCKLKWFQLRRKCKFGKLQSTLA